MIGQQALQETIARIRSQAEADPTPGGYQTASALLAGAGMFFLILNQHESEAAIQVTDKLLDPLIDHYDKLAKGNRS